MSPILHIALALWLAQSAVGPGSASQVTDKLIGSDSNCSLDAAASIWIGGALEAWEHVGREDLRLAPAALPWVLLFDESCVWHVNPDAAALSGQPAATVSLTPGATAVQIYGLPHTGSFRLPDNGVVDAKLATFSATYGDNDRPYIVMALPSIWRRDPRYAVDPELPRLMRSVFVHEMTHTRQSHSIGARLSVLQKLYKLPDDLSDDIIQQRFADRNGFKEAYESERDLLYRAAAAQAPDERKDFARQAFAAMKARRAKYFVGADAVYAELEDLFLGMEGAANWAAVRAAASEHQNLAEAVTSVRRGGRYWSQDEGLALFLVIDAMVPGWQSRVFGPSAVSVFALLSEAAR